MKKQSLGSKLSLSRKVISNLQSEALKGGSSWRPTNNGISDFGGCGDPPVAASNNNSACTYMN